MLFSYLIFMAHAIRHVRLYGLFRPIEYSDCLALQRNRTSGLQQKHIVTIFSRKMCPIGFVPGFGMHFL